MKNNPQSGLSITSIITIVACIVGLLVVLGIYTRSYEPADITQVSETSIESEVSLVAMADDDVEPSSEPAATMEAPVAMMSDDMDANEDVMETDVAANTTTPEPALAGTFQNYSADKLTLAADGTVVLFFHANWCPSCRGLESDINASLSDIPADTHILKLDYDTETELKRKYGIVRQHTLVVVDANGNEIKKLTGLTNTLEQVVNQI